MNGLWTIEERNRWADIRGRLALADMEVAALLSLATRYAATTGYHLSNKDRADIERMIEALRKIQAGALPCPDEVREREAA